jgi:hypothetical protein
LPCITPLYHLLRRSMRPVIAGGGAHTAAFRWVCRSELRSTGFLACVNSARKRKSPELLAPALLGSVLQRKFAAHRSTERRFGKSEGIPGGVKSASTRRYGHFQTGCEAASVSTLRRPVLRRRYVSGHAYLRMDGRNDRFLWRSGDLDRTVFQRCYRTRQDRVLLPRQRLSRRIFSRLDFHAASNPDCRS